MIQRALVACLTLWFGVVAVGIPAQEMDAAALALRPLGLEVEGRPVTDPQTVLFYGPRVPRVHMHGTERISEREFFEIAGDGDAARNARVHRGVNIGLTTLSILSFFGGLALFGAADQVDLGLVGLPPETQGRILSLGMLGGSLVPSIAVMIRGQQWAPLEYSYQTMRTFNDGIGTGASR
tara:strand:- start:37 stop:576 length:540 start_codon:yes stop_codon:yes gene_type:complete